MSKSREREEWRSRLRPGGPSGLGSSSCVQERVRESLTMRQIKNVNSSYTFRYHYCNINAQSQPGNENEHNNLEGLSLK